MLDSDKQAVIDMRRVNVARISREISNRVETHYAQPNLDWADAGDLQRVIELLIEAARILGAKVPS
jgi:hypothetical protein